MTPDQASDVVVIGGGILGTSIALHLADLGVDVTLMDRDEPVNATSGSFAEVSAIDVGDTDHYLLAAMGVSDWHRWEYRLGTDVGLRWTGSVRWATNGDEERRLRALVERASGRGYPVAAVDPAEITKIAPGLSEREVLYAARASDDGRVDPWAIVSAARPALEASGVRILSGVEASFDLSGPGPRVVADGEVFDPSVVVVTAGADSRAIAEKVGLDLPIESQPGLSIATSPIEERFDPTLHLPLHGREVRVRQADDGRLLINLMGADAVPGEDHARRLLHSLAHPFPSAALADVEKVILSWRPVPSDGLPIVGPLVGAPNVYITIGHPGITLAPTLGRLVATEIDSGEPVERLSPFRPERFTRRAAETLLDVESIFLDQPDGS